MVEVAENYDYSWMYSGIAGIKQLRSICGGELNVCIEHATLVTCNNLKKEKKWFQVDAFYDKQIKRPYLVVKYSKESYNHVVLPVFSEEGLSPAEIHDVFNLLHPPGDPFSYEKGLIMALVSSDQSIVYHNISTGLVPPTGLIPLTEQPASSIPRSRKLKKVAKDIKRNTGSSKE